METKTDKGVLLKGIRAVAAHYKASTRSIQELVNSGKIPVYRIGKNTHFYSGEIDEALRDKSREKK